MPRSRFPSRIAALFAVLLFVAAWAGPSPAVMEVVLTEGTNVAAAVSPDGSRIAFDLQGRIWTVPVEGGEATVLTDPFGDARQPSWRPDGGRIVFQSYRDGNWHLWSVDAGGDDLRQLTFGPYDDREPRWSPDGGRIAFSSDRGGGYDVWVLDVESREVRRLTEHEANEYQPAWSPDGRRVAYATDRDEGAGIRIREADGSERTAIRIEEGEAFGPAWSPDGRSISYTVIGDGWTRLRAVDADEAGEADPRTLSDDDEDVFPFRASWLSADELLYTGDGHLRRRALDGQGHEDVPFRAAVTLRRPDYSRQVRNFDDASPRPVRGLVSPSVSPDGASVAFAALGDVWIQEIGGELRRLTGPPHVESDPVFSPDGRRLAYVSDRGGSPDLWIRDLETDRDRRVTDAPTIEAEPAWAPDGRQLAHIAQGGMLEGTAIRIRELKSDRARTIRSGLFAPGRPTWSPDGRTVAVGVLDPYSTRFREGVNRIVLLDAEVDSTQEGRRLDVLPHRSLGTRGVNGPVWSPDGRSLAVVVSGLLHRIPVTPGGEVLGPPERLTDELVDAPTWSGDSRSIVYLDAGRLERISLVDGAVEEIPVELTWRRSNPDERWVLHAGRLWDGRSRRLRSDVDVWIDGHRIVRVEPHRDHGGARSVDASDGVVIPGLIETHSHQGRTTENLGRIWLSYGITTVRDPSSDPHEGVSRRELWASGGAVAPRLFTAGSTVDGSRIYYAGGQPVESVAQLEELLGWADTLDYDMLKTYVRLPDRLQKRAVSLAHRIGIPVSSHEIYPAVAYGTDGVEHVRGTSRRGYSPKVSELYRTYQDIVGLLSESGMTLTPTVGIYGAYPVLVARDPGLLDDPRLRALFPEGTVEELRRRAGELEEDPGVDVRAQMVRHMAGTARRVVEAGGRVIAGTDSPIIPYGHSYHLELKAYVELGGMSPYETLRSATAVAAEALGAGEDLGTVEAGKLADLAVLEGDPLEEIENTRRVRAVVENGRYRSVEELLREPGSGAP